LEPSYDFVELSFEFNEFNGLNYVLKETQNINIPLSDFTVPYPCRNGAVSAHVNNIRVIDVNNDMHSDFLFTVQLNFEGLA
jgi:hypothetical protein